MSTATNAKPSRVAATTALLRGAAEGAAAAVARRLPWTKDQNDPIVLLEADHRRFEKLLEQGEATTERGYQEHHVADLIIRELHKLANERREVGREVQGPRGCFPPRAPC